MHPFLSQVLSKALVDRQDRHRKRVLAEWQAKQACDAVTADARAAAQKKELADLLNYARTRVPFYRERLGSVGMVAPDEALAVLRRLPVIHRAELQQAPEAFRAEDVGDVFPDATGGSTGTPLRFVVDRATQQAREASLYWSDGLAGWRYGERIAMLWGSDKDVKSAGQQARADLRWWIDNRRWYNAFNMGEDRMAEFHCEMTRFRPHIIVAYAGSMEVYARYLETSGVAPAYPLRAIICSAEMLTPQARATIHRIFQVPVFNRYGNREFGAIAAECPAREGLHVNERDFILEIDSPDPVREAGPLIVTYLRNRAQPFLRYSTGDLARFLPDERCSCGRTTRRLAGLAGRVADTIRTRQGKLIHGEFFTHLLYGAPRVREFQFVQETMDRYRLLLVTDGEESAAILDRLRHSILEEIGPQSHLEVVRVEQIPVLPSGKRKFTLSLVG